jgi:hypothetical protein
MGKNIIVSNIKGGFGNQLFQYATGLNIALKNNAEYKLDLRFFDIPKFKDAFRLDYLNIDYSIATPDDYIYLRNSEDKITLPYRLLNKLKIKNKFKKLTHIIDNAGFEVSYNIINATSPAYIEGWCVKEKYFREIRNKLIEIFSPKVPFSNQALIIYDKIINSNSVSIHIRRGDYIDNDIFEVLSLNYYSSAMRMMQNKVNAPEFFLFSDDLLWARHNLKEFDNITYVDLGLSPDYMGKCDVEDFFLMKSCKHNIIANSSFSWWPAYLNENPEKIVIAPLENNWYKSSFYRNSLINSSFLPEDWIRL